MLNREWIERTEAFLKEKMDGGFLASRPEEKNYRIEHSYRVANIGLEIARREGFDETEMAIACLLHDVSYCEDFGGNGYRDHGRRSAAIARSFLTALGMAADRVCDVCYGIAIHVDDKADFPGERTAFALSVSDADNIDRFDAYRIHEALQKDGFLAKNVTEKREYVDKRLKRLRELLEWPTATETAATLWKERLSFYIGFYEKLASQLECSTRVLDRSE